MVSLVIIRGNFEDYKTPNAFFTRDLKKGVRPIVRCKNLILSPVDGTVSIYEKNLPTSNAIQLHQVKGVRYDLNEFVGEPVHIADSNNLYSVVLYLSPANYHRIHAPSNFAVENRVHVPGQLLPVKAFYANKVKGFFSMGLVGAFNVGSILLENTKDPVVTNRPNELLYKNYRHRARYEAPWEVSQGEKVGAFEMGSTVVLAFEAPQFTWLVVPGEKVRVGQPLGYVEYDEEVERVTEVEYPEAVRRGLLKCDECAEQPAETAESVEEVESTEVVKDVVESVESVSDVVNVVKEVKDVVEVVNEVDAVEKEMDAVVSEIAEEVVKEVMEEPEVPVVPEMIEPVNEVVEEDAWILHPTSWERKNEDMW